MFISDVYGGSAPKPITATIVPFGKGYGVKIKGLTKRYGRDRLALALENALSDELELVGTRYAPVIKWANVMLTDDEGDTHPLPRAVRSRIVVRYA